MKIEFTKQQKTDLLNGLKEIRDFTRNGDNYYIYKFLNEKKIAFTVVPILKSAGIIKVYQKKYRGAVAYIWNTIEPNIYMAEKILYAIRDYNSKNNQKAKKRKLVEKNAQNLKSSFDKEIENLQKGVVNNDEPKQQIIPIEKAKKMLNYSDIERLFGKPLSDFEMMDKGTNDKLKSLEKENERLSNVVKDLNKELVNVHAIKRELEKQKETNKTRCFNVLWGVITIKW